MTGTFPDARSAGYYMPAEWTEHARCWMAWPCRESLWGGGLGLAQQQFADVANAIAEFEPVTMLCPPAFAAGARDLCGTKVELLQIELDDSWTRDTGPNFVINHDNDLAASIFQFNAWGRKYTHFARDAALGHRIAEYLEIRAFTSTIFMEGGGINVDGEGTVLCTEQNVLNRNRNPGLDKADAEDALCAALGAEKVLWLPGDPDDSETDGHIDGIACFVEPGKILVEVCPAEGTQRYDNMQANLEAARAGSDARGRRLQVAVIEEAHEAERTNEIFASSYINFYIANNAVIMPGFGIDRDADARGIVAGLFPDREIVQLNVSGIAPGGGGIHCNYTTTTGDLTAASGTNSENSGSSRFLITGGRPAAAISARASRPLYRPT